MVAITPDTGYQVGSVTVNGETVDIPADGKLSGLDKDDKVVVTFERVPDATDLPFADVASSDWYQEAVEYVYENSMMNGTSATTFSPNGTTTRAMIVTILHRFCIRLYGCGSRRVLRKCSQLGGCKRHRQRYQRIQLRAGGTDHP